MDKQIWHAMVALQPRLRRFAFGLVGSMDEADELVQMAYERAISHIAQWQPGTRLDSWMFRIVHTIRINRYHADRVRGGNATPVDPDTLQDDGAERRLESSLTLQSVRGFIAALPEDQKAALLLVAVEGLSYKEASDALGVPIGTLTSRIARARTTLKQLVDGGSAGTGLSGDMRPNEAP